VYAFAPGQQPHPVAIQRHFTLIKEKNLDLAEFVAENRAAVVKGAKQVGKMHLLRSDTQWLLQGQAAINMNSGYYRDWM
jgi:hypothetical protein